MTEKDLTLKHRQSTTVPSPIVAGLLPSLTLFVYTLSQTSILLFIAPDVPWIRPNPETYSPASSGAHVILSEGQEKSQSPQKLIQETL